VPVRASHKIFTAGRRYDSKREQQKKRIGNLEGNMSRRRESKAKAEGGKSNQAEGKNELVTSTDAPHWTTSSAGWESYICLNNLFCSFSLLTTIISLE